jgi:hypothetical protein
MSMGRIGALIGKCFKFSGDQCSIRADVRDDVVTNRMPDTVGYKGLSGGELMYKLLFYGVSAICLNTTGSLQEGLRVCTSFIQDNQYDVLDERLKAFHQDMQAGE